MKKIFLLLFAFLVFFTANILAQGAKYTLHTLAQGETLSMLAEKYKTTVGDIMRLNGMHADTKLVTGEKIKIPASGETVVRAGDTKPLTTSKNIKPAVTPAKPVATVVKQTATVANNGPATHIVQQGETLYAISKKFGVSVDQLKKLNNMQDNNIEPGQELALNTKGIDTLAAKKTEEQKDIAIKSVPDNTPPVVIKPVIKNDTKPADSSTVQIENKADNTSVAVNNTTEQVTPKINTINVSKDGSDSYFAKSFTDNATGKSSKTVSGTAMIFKTASGWNDKKFYILMRDAASGSIVKITSSSGKIIYAKVLWSLDDMKINEGLQFRISEAAAAALDINSSKFQLAVQYYQ